MQIKELKSVPEHPLDDILLMIMKETSRTGLVDADYREHKKHKRGEMNEGLTSRLDG